MLQHAVTCETWSNPGFELEPMLAATDIRFLMYVAAAGPTVDALQGGVGHNTSHGKAYES